MASCCISSAIKPVQGSDAGHRRRAWCRRCHLLAGRVGRAGGRSSRGCEEHPADEAPGLRSCDDGRVEAKASTVAMQRKDQHQHKKKEIGPRPLAGGAVEAEPQIEYLQSADDAPKPHI